MTSELPSELSFAKAAAIVHQALPVHRFRETVTYTSACKHAPGRFVDLPLGRCHIVDRGEGAAIVLVHGFLYSTFMWEPIVPALEVEFRTVNVDLFGWGYSQRDVRREYTYELYARQLLQLLDALKLDKATIVGQSMGGGTAIRFATEHPERVERLVLVDAASLPNPLAATGRAYSVPLLGELLLTLGGDAMISKVLKDLWYFNKRHVTPAHVKRVAAPLRIEGSSWTLLSILRTLDFGSQESHVRRLAELNIPSMLVWGRQDRAVPLEVGERMHRLLPRSRMVVLDNAGHSPHEEHPELCLSHVLPFLRGE